MRRMCYLRLFVLSVLVWLAVASPSRSSQKLSSKTINMLNPSGKPWKVCFHCNEARERGTEQAIYDYAYFGRKLYNYHSVIIFPLQATLSKHLPTSSYSRFANEFPIHSYQPGENLKAGGKMLTSLVEYLACDVLYIIKAGDKVSVPRYPDSFSLHIPTVVHAVFSWQPHGDAYAAVGKRFNGQVNDLVVPHMVVPPGYYGNSTNKQGLTDKTDKKKRNNIPSRDMKPVVVRKWLREELRIPNTSRTICRHGGYDTFDIPFVHTLIVSLIRGHVYSDQELHFIFMNTQDFVNGFIESTDMTNYYRQIHFIAGMVGDKEFFFDACDVMLHARSSGETFGIAVAEFSIRNKPVITNNVIEPMEHVRILGLRGFYYHDGESLRKQIDYFVRQRPGNLTGDFNAYLDYYPEVVMRQFHDVFVQGVSSRRGNPAVSSDKSLQGKYDIPQPKPRNKAQFRDPSEREWEAKAAAESKNSTGTNKKERAVVPATVDLSSKEADDDAWEFFSPITLLTWAIKIFVIWLLASSSLCLCRRCSTKSSTPTTTSSLTTVSKK